MRIVESKRPDDAFQERALKISNSCRHGPWGITFDAITKKKFDPPS